MASLYAWTVLEDDGREGLIGAMLPGISLGMTPLVSGRLSGAQRLKPYAEAHALSTGKQCRLIRFAEAETLEWVSPPKAENETK